MDMYESRHVLTAKDTMKAWSNFQQFYKKLMQYYVAKSSKNVIFTAHVQSILNEQEMIMEKKVPIKGALKANGIESYFSTIVSARAVNLDTLEGYQNPLLNITADEQAIGLKYVYQTRLTKETVNERIRAPMGMWQINETFIDNNAQYLLDRLQEYYT
jgi:predicted transcriptional regulator